MNSRTIVMFGAATVSAALVAYSAVLIAGADADPSPSASLDPDAAPRLAPRRGGPSSMGPVRRGVPLRAGIGARPTSSHEEEAPVDAGPEALMAEHIRFEQDREATFMAQFDAETVDTRWAGQWEPQLSDALDSKLGRLPGFGGITVECRTGRCVAEASWENYSAATLALDAAADATKGACATSVFMPPPDDPSAPYRHSVRFSSCQDAPS